MSKTSWLYLRNWALIVIVGFFLFVQGLPILGASLEVSNATVVYDGWTVAVNSTGPVEVLAYSTEVTAGATLFDESGKEVLQTVAQDVPGSYSAKATLPQGKYTLKGQRTILQFSGSNFLSYENPKMRGMYQDQGWLYWIFFCVIMALANYSWARQEKAQVEN